MTNDQLKKGLALQERIDKLEKKTNAKALTGDAINPRISHVQIRVVHGEDNFYREDVLDIEIECCGLPTDPDDTKMFLNDYKSAVVAKIQKLQTELQNL